MQMSILGMEKNEFIFCIIAICTCTLYNTKTKSIQKVN